QIMSGFFSAFFNFTQNLCGADVQDIELGPYRILFEIVEEELILVVIFDKSDSIINVQQKLMKIKDIVSDQYSNVIKKKICNTEDFVGLEEIVNKILSPQIDQFATLKAEFIKILGELKSNDEISDCTLISVNGITLWQEKKREFLDLSIKQMDAFWKYKTKVLDQIILSYENKFLILIKINDRIVLSTLIKPNTPIGLATLLVEEYASKIQNLTEERLFF
ncbi:MAG: hypothetical protein ACTSO9_12440, partial [Candidatus Helarchaeota archaeon]